MRYLLTIKYDGSKFNGFQRLKNTNSVQKCIEDALSVILKEDIKIKGAGRTDRGVHANGQRCHFDSELKMDIDKLIFVLNNLLKPYIYVTDCKLVSDEFHARFSVIEKHYSYKINLGEFDPLKADYYMQPYYKIDIKMLKKVSKLFTGAHNFKNFVSGKRENYESIINKINIRIRNKELIIDLFGQGFYRYMVRHIVGAMLEVARGKVSIVDIKSMLDCYDIDKKLSLAPACGLYLENIYY